jgi:hypothetical protein
MSMRKWLKDRGFAFRIELGSLLSFERPVENQITQQNYADTAYYFEFRFREYALRRANKAEFIRRRQKAGSRDSKRDLVPSERIDASSQSRNEASLGLDET